MHDHVRPFRTIWLAALGCFLLAGAAGVLFRVGMMSDLPDGLNMLNIRHAHSHLMYFGWVTPAIMALIATHTPGNEVFRPVIWGTLALAVAAFASFLMYGYNLIPIGEQRLPLSVILSTLNMIAWYVFAALYIRHRRSISYRPARRLWDAAVVFLVLSSLGAWALGAVQMAPVESPLLYAASLHLFLDLFAEGWLLLALLGLAFATVRPAETATARWGFALLIIGIPGTFLLGMSADLVPSGLALWGSASGVLASIGLLLSLFELMRGASTTLRRLWAVPVVLLGIKAVAQLGFSIPAVGEWAQGMGLRIIYLHVLLLGGITLGLLTAAVRIWHPTFAVGRTAVSGSVLLLLLTLVPLSGLWPAEWSGRWVLYAAAGGAAVPVVTVAVLWWNAYTGAIGRRSQVAA